MGGRTITYDDLAVLMNNGMWGNWLAKPLGAISHYEARHGRPLLSAIVVKNGTRDTGDGFWILVEDELHIPVEDRERWLRAEQAAVFAYWA